MPPELNWNLFLGVAPEVPYHPIYHPFNWRGWIDWGMGAIGDMGAHLIDHSMWALDLGYPTTIETISTPFNGASYPLATQTFYEFPARGSKPPVKLTWYDGGLLPPKPVELPDNEQLNKGGGALLVGTKGKLLHDTYGLHPRLLPASLHASVGTPPKKLPRIPGEDHELNWVNAAKGTTPSVVAVRIRREAHRSHAPRRRRSARRPQNRIRRRRHARHQRRLRQRFPPAHTAHRLVIPAGSMRASRNNTLFVHAQVYDLPA